jgi:adenosylcobinamide-phosphate synthase
VTIGPAVGGLMLDHLLGEPPVRWHPVVWYGSAMKRVEKQLYADRRRNGAAFTAVGVGLGISVGVVLRRLVGPTIATGVATAVCAAGRMLDHEANAIADVLTSGDLPAARLRLSGLVGRTTDNLDESEVSRAVIESVAENGVDAVTASLFWAAVGGAPAVLAHRAINTLDAMVGHHNDRYENFGWASARLDDVVNYLPARATALAVAAVRPNRAAEVWRIVRRDAPQHPSPNGGVVEAAFAAALNVRLGGSNEYHGVIEDRGQLGDGPPPAAASIADAIRLRRHATAGAAALLLIGTAVVRPVRRHFWQSSRATWSTRLRLRPIGPFLPASGAAE